MRSDRPDPDERFKIEDDAEEAPRDLPRVDPDSVPADPDEPDKPKPADAPLKNQGDALSD